ncbi:Arylsulfatase A and related enzymes [Aquiflexum balticum DSM 16537]|uniref:Arylsulfatase A and related enzymes n=1 Tax=Aquiflexum balticum DSM 16537 TaxID=758820 RepID=A0A1W2H9B5_9BACT|nr:sulfatase [Aquiflexum balticum]SMD45447.1 Arylsulfatase A and related enzymes [Aquiflexum balticum DSM 16537]
MKILFLFLLLSSSVVEEKSNSEKKPNILFLIADDWSFPHAGAYGDHLVRTPTFDRLAAEGALFINAYTASPSCSPSRASILNGRYPHQNEQGGNLWSEWPAQFPTYVSLLEEAGYFTGSTRKGWGPGDFQVSGLEHNPAGKVYNDFETFYKAKDEGQPFTFWFGSSDPHREYVANTGIQSGMKLSDVAVPEFYPDLDCIRNDILDYYFEVERFDRECGQIINFLEEIGELDNTIIVMTSDNGMPFPRAKANLYDLGTRMPLAMRWPTKIKAGTQEKSFVNFVDFAPSFLEATGIQPENMSGKSLWPILEGQTKGDQEVFLERERHANVRKGDLSYPMRAVRTHEYLYIRNIMPERFPAGDPSVHQSVGQFGDVDHSITKFLIMAMEGKTQPGAPDYFQLNFGLRPEEELYAVQEDPYQINNLAADPEFAGIKKELRKRLEYWMLETGDKRAVEPRSTYWDQVRYTPSYQMKDADIPELIKTYRIMPPFGPYSRDGIPCLNH